MPSRRDASIRFAAIFALVLAAALLVACNARRPLTAEDIDEEKLVATLLTIEDMPTGWAVNDAAAFEQRTPGGTYDIYCTTLPARSIAAAEVSLSQGSFGPFVFQNTVIYPDSQSAEDAFNDLRAAVENCPEETDGEGNVTTYSVVAFPSLGDQTYALRSSRGLADVEGARVRIGNVIISVAQSGVGGVDSEQTEVFVRAAVDKFNDTWR